MISGITVPTFTTYLPLTEQHNDRVPALKPIVFLISKTKPLQPLSLDISKAYPEIAGVNSWNRTVRLNRGKNVEVNDIISLQKADKNNPTPGDLLCSRSDEPGELTIHYVSTNKEPKDFVIKYNSKQMLGNGGESSIGSYGR
jgi:hypothetical protein